MNHEKSKELFEEAKQYLPGGVDSPVRAFKPYPFFVKRAEGSKLYDVDGNSYIDYCLGYGPLVLGHSNRQILEAVNKQLPYGTLYGTPSEKELILAKEVVKRVPCADMVRFTNTGTESTMSAIRLARAVTGVNKIIKFDGSYHGAHDAVLVKSGSGAVGKPDSPGVPEGATENTLVIPFNDPDAVRKVIKDNKGEIACIIMEPVMGNIGCIPPQEGFLEFLREITEENGILLIFDEVITGFRLAKGGAQEYFGVTPDLTTFGKIIGGGFPIAAFTGKKEYMERIAPSGDVYQAGTYSGNPVSVTAGIATLEQLNDNFYKQMAVRAEYMREEIINIIGKLDIDFTMNGIGTMSQLYFTKEPVIDATSAKTADTELFTKYYNSLLNEGVFMAPSQFECCFLSNRHSKLDIDNTMTAVENALKAAKDE
jgi:glutamate-1-semialdehyde 2,1-aminomutase